MFAVISGRPGCPYCAHTKESAERLNSKHENFNFHYTDIRVEGVIKASLEKTIGKPAGTAPQTFVDQKHINGCTDFEVWAEGNMNLFV